MQHLWRWNGGVVDGGRRWVPPPIMVEEKMIMVEEKMKKARECKMMYGRKQIQSTMYTFLKLIYVVVVSLSLNLPGWCWARIKQLALIGSSSSLHSEVCNALGASDGDIHSEISFLVECSRATANF